MSGDENAEGSRAFALAEFVTVDGRKGRRVKAETAVAGAAPMISRANRR
jgi:hypothetical protein